MSTASYLLNRRGYFHLKFRIPSDLYAAIPSRQNIKSLKTKDKNTARIASVLFNRASSKRLRQPQEGSVILILCPECRVRYILYFIVN
jgi:Domain of unknown function (DUF6538)